MTAETNDPKTRVFVYNGQSFRDPGAEFTVDDIRKQLAIQFPEVARAKIVKTANDDGTITVEFVKDAGTKGRQPCEQDARECCGRHQPSEAAPAPHVIHSHPVISIQDGPEPVAVYLTHERRSTYAPVCPFCDTVVPVPFYVDIHYPKTTIPCPQCTKTITISVVHLAIYTIRPAE